MSHGNMFGEVRPRRIVGRTADFRRLGILFASSGFGKASRFGRVVGLPENPDVGAAGTMECQSQLRLAVPCRRGHSSPESMQGSGPISQRCGSRASIMRQVSETTRSPNLGPAMSAPWVWMRRSLGCMLGASSGYIGRGGGRRERSAGGGGVAQADLCRMSIVSSGGSFTPGPKFDQPNLHSNIGAHGSDFGEVPSFRLTPAWSIRPRSACV